jgi:hypothetical protein
VSLVPYSRSQKRDGSVPNRLPGIPVHPPICKRHETTWLYHMPTPQPVTFQCAEHRARSSDVLELQGNGVVRNASGCFLGNRKFQVPAQLAGSTEASVNDEVMFIPGKEATVAEHESSAVKEIKQLDHLRAQLHIPHVRCCYTRIRLLNVRIPQSRGKTYSLCYAVHSPLLSMAFLARYGLKKFSWLTKTHTIRTPADDECSSTHNKNTTSNKRAQTSSDEDAHKSTGTSSCVCNLRT